MDTENKKRIVLLVDDDNFMADMYAIKFKEHRFEVHAHTDSSVALDVLRDGLTPNVILIDMIMPGTSGVEFLKIIKKEGLAKGAVLIVLSNQKEDSDVKAALSAGAHDYIVKANTIPSEVLSRVEKVISEQREKSL